MDNIAIFTPTYNRAGTLKNLYESLKNQTNKFFKWYIIDDGSTDETEIIVKNFINDDFEIIYKKKQNGGKHTAINFGIQFVEEELTFIVDSDDCLTMDAVETIHGDWKKYSKENVAGLSYYRIDENGNILGKEYNGIIVDSYADMRINRKDLSDKAEIYKTEILKKYRFPEFDGEVFLSEAVAWNSISRDGYEMAYIPKGIYICEYLSQGLTKLGRKLRLECFNGTLEHAKSFFYDDINIFIRLKYVLYYVAVSDYAKCIKTSYKKLEKKYRFFYAALFIPGLMISKLWKKQYK